MTTVEPPAQQLAWREALCDAGRSLFNRGYVHATAGNLSARLPPQAGGGTLITPTDACLGTLEPAQLCWVDDQGHALDGSRPSKTLGLHRSVYALDAQAGCIIHTHSTHLVALTLRGAWPPGACLPPVTPYFVMKVGRVPCLPYRRPGSPDVPQLLRQAWRASIDDGRALRAIMLDRLGPVVWHASVQQAMATLEELEETARLLCLVQGQPDALSAVQLDELQAAFGVRW